MLLKLIVSLFLWDIASFATTIDDCPKFLKKDKYLQVFDNKCYMFTPDKEHMYSDATFICTDLFNGNVLKITSQETQNFVSSQMSTYDYDGSLWIGLTKNTTDEKYYWDDGASLDYNNFGRNLSGEIGNCVYMDLNKGGEWVPSACDGNAKYPFMCEFPQDPNLEIGEK